MTASRFRVAEAAPGAPRLHTALTKISSPRGPADPGESDRRTEPCTSHHAPPVRVALFVTCLNDTLFPEAGIAMVRVLKGLGHDVEFPEAQTCCGELHFSTGYEDPAAALARRFVQVFAELTLSSHRRPRAWPWCENYPDLPEQVDAADLACDVRELVPRVVQLTEFLVTRLGVTDVGASFRHRVTYHTPSGRRALCVSASAVCAPARRGRARFVESPRADECCGFGGTFAMKNAETSSGNSRRQARGSHGDQCRGGCRGRHVVPVADRWGLFRRGAAVQTGTSPRSWRRHEQGFLGRRTRGSSRHAAQTEPARDDDVRGKRAVVTAERPDWEELRSAGEALKRCVLRHLDHYLLLRFEWRYAAGGVVHRGLRLTGCERDRGGTRPQNRSPRGGEGEVVDDRRDRGQRRACYCRSQRSRPTSPSSSASSPATNRLNPCSGDPQEPCRDTGSLPT